MLYEHFLLGGLGGIARAAVGITKAYKREDDFRWDYALMTVVASAIIGAAAGILLDSDPKLSLVAGYAGTDILENSYKIMFLSKK